AGRNANDGISLIQTAEGALAETHSILQRVRELAVQSSNGTYEEGVVNSDRDQLDKEVQALKSEIDRIADSTHFNNKKLLNGNLSANGVFNPGAATADKIPTLDGLNGTVGTTAAGKDGKVASAAAAAVYEIDVTGMVGAANSDKVTIGGVDITVADSVSGQKDDALATSIAKAFNKAAGGTASAIAGYTATTSGSKLIITADVPGAEASAMAAAMANGISASTGITGTTSAAAELVTAGRDEGKGAAATFFKSDITIDFSKLKGGEVIKIGDKTITFSLDKDGNDGTNANNQFVKIGAVNEPDATTSTKLSAGAVAARNTFMNSLNTAVTATVGDANYNMKVENKSFTTTTDLTATGSFSIKADSAVAAAKGSAGNLGIFRDSSTSAAFAITNVNGHDEQRGTEAKFATASVDVDFSKFKAGDKLTIAGKSI
ncbi:MAG: hypothetical protein RSB25_20760, partial [Acinetobacter sp.]